MALLSYDGQDLHFQTGTQALLFDITKGYWEPMFVRGVDTIVPSAVGRVPRNRVKDVLQVEITGVIWGVTPDDWVSAAQLFWDLMDPNAFKTLTVNDGYFGASGRSVDCRYLNAVPGDIKVSQFQRLSVVLEAVTDWAS